jgi:type I restriction enzyme M protein
MFTEWVEAVARQRGEKLNSKRWNLIRAELSERDEDAIPVLRKERRLRPGDSVQLPLPGEAIVERGGQAYAVAWEPNPDLRDTEQVPLLTDGGIEEFMSHEVLPYAPDAWVDPSKTQIGYEISFTRHFYKPKPLRTLAEIRAEIEALERETEGLLDEILVG